MKKYFLFSTKKLISKFYHINGNNLIFFFLGGLVSDLVRLLPLDSGRDLYLYKHPDVPANLLYLVRPYQHKDESAIYRLVAAAYEEEIDAPMGKK